MPCKKYLSWCRTVHRRDDEKPNADVVEDTEEMRKWRSLSQSEMDLCWKNLAKKMEEEVMDKYMVELKMAKGRLLEAKVTRWKGGECAKTRNTK